MKKLFYFFVFAMLSSLSSIAQTPTYATGLGTSNNVFPFGSSSSNKVQWLYLSSDFTPTMPTGQITKVYFRTWSGSGYNATYGNLNIRMLSTTATGFASTSTFVTGATPVYSASTFSTGTLGSYTWWSVTLQTPFSYMAGDNLIVEIEQNSLSGSVTANCQAGPGGTTRRLWGSYGSTTPTGSGTGSYGDIGFDIVTGPPCPAPTNLAAANITSSTADLSWTAVSGTTGYDYLIDQNATVQYPNTPVTTMATTVNATGLTPATNYYLHVRNRCSATNFSPWITIPFTTLPPCKPPVGFHTTDLSYNYAKINWSPWASALSYDYVVDQSPAAPMGTTGVINTIATSAPVPGLSENTWYYVHIRSLCAGNEVSNWSLDSFLTPIICRNPELAVDHINVDEGVTYWSPVPTAYEYEYALTQSSTPPAVGTKYNYTSIHTSALKDGVDYYMHVRCHCESVGVFSTSGWSTVSFKTFPLGIDEATGKEINLSVYPNPVKEMMYIEISGNVNGTGKLQLLDIAGKTLRQMEINRNKTPIDMSGYPAGVYILKYEDLSRNKTIKINKE